MNRMAEVCKHKDYEVFDKLEDTILAECNDCEKILIFILEKPFWFESVHQKFNKKVNENDR